MTAPPRARPPTMRAAGLLLLLLVLLPAASAHAVLQSADPAPNARIEVGATVIEFRFTEDVEREYTNADVLDVQGESWAAGPVEFDPDARNVIRLPVRPLTDGIYEASWKALSVDTHTTRGTFVFAVGNATLAPGAYRPTVVAQDMDQVVRDGFARFAFYAGLFAVVGIPLFTLVVLRDPNPPRGLYLTAASFALVGAAGALVGLFYLAQRTELGAAVLASAPARSFAWRGALVLAAGAACAWAALRPASWRAASIAALVLGVGSVAATALGSHAAAIKDNEAIFVLADAVHLGMGAVWIGGVVGFLHVVWGRSALEVASMVNRFTPLAMASVLLLLATGTLASVAHMPCARDWSAGFPCVGQLGSENYVRLVALKLFLMLPLIGIGAYHKYRVGPRLARGVWSPRVFARALQVEAGVMALVLLAAGVLAASSPPETDAQTAEYVPPYLEMDNFTKTTHVILQVSPNPVTVGIQKLVVVVHPLGERLPNSTHVALKVQGPGEREPDLTIDPEKVTPNEWEIEDGLFTRAGTWRVIVLLQLPDEFVKIPFDVDVAPPGGSPASS